MGLITKGEATHRLKLIAIKLNNAATSARDGDWELAQEATEEARAMIDSILPHLDEAANDPQYQAQATRGGMGYRGGTGWQEHVYGTSGSNPPSKKKNHSAPPVVSYRPPSPIDIPTPPPAPPPKPPVVTPPAEVRRLERHKPLVGEKVQWERNYMLLMPEARILERISEDGKWGFVEGSPTGIPYDELIPESDV